MDRHHLAEGSAGASATDAVDEIESAGFASVVASAPIQRTILSGSVRKAKTVAHDAAIWVSCRTTSDSFIGASLVTDMTRKGAVIRHRGG